MFSNIAPSHVDAADCRGDRETLIDRNSVRYAITGIQDSAGSATRCITASKLVQTLGNSSLFMGKGGGRADRERTAWMEINKAGILNVSKNI